jgi:hypothetical protein
MSTKNDLSLQKHVKTDGLLHIPGSLPPRLQPNRGFNIQPLNNSVPPGLNSSSATSLGNNLPGYSTVQGLLNTNQLNLAMYAGLNQMQLGQLAQMGQIGQFAQMGQMGMRFPGMMQGYLPMNALMELDLKNKYFMPQGARLNPVQNLFAEQLKAFKMPPPAPTVSKLWKESFPLKRAAFHVGIAYKIYFDKLKSKGVSV